MHSRQYQNPTAPVETRSDINMRAIQEAFGAASEASNIADIAVEEVMLRAANAMPEGASEFDRGVAVGMVLTRLYPALIR